jgi:hypothetical protein
VNEEPNNLQRAMDEAAKVIQEPAKPVAYADPQRLVDTAKRLLRQQQDRLVTGRADYESERTARSNWFRSEMSKLSDEAEAEMGMLERKWEEEEIKINLIIRQVKALLSTT